MKIIKICRQHGDLTLENVIKSGFYKGEQVYKCKQCMKQIHRNNYVKNRDKILTRTNKWGRENIERKRELNIKYYNSLKREKLPANFTQARQYRIAKNKLVNLLFDIERHIRNANKKC